MLKAKKKSAALLKTLRIKLKKIKIRLKHNNKIKKKPRLQTNFRNKHILI